MRRMSIAPTTKDAYAGVPPPKPEEVYGSKSCEVQLVRVAFEGEVGKAIAVYADDGWLVSAMTRNELSYVIWFQRPRRTQ